MGLTEAMTGWSWVKWGGFGGGGGSGSLRKEPDGDKESFLAQYHDLYIAFYSRYRSPTSSSHELN